MKNPFFRHPLILCGDDVWLSRQLAAFFALNQHKSAVYCAPQPPEILPPNCTFYAFVHAKNLLGQEWDCAVYDTRQSSEVNFNLEALAIVAAAIKAGGILLILLPKDWQIQVDLDSLRWNGTAQAITPSHFYQWWQSAVERHQIPIYQQTAINPSLPHIATDLWQQPPSARVQQQRLLQQMLAAQAELYLLTAKRGRGKSALAGMLADKLSEQSAVFLTAPNQNAVQALYRHCQNKPHFMAPDDLIARLNENPQPFAESWLIIDEAAMIPLDMLATICCHFAHILLTTTIDGYEGTGRGFELKFKQLTNRTCQLLHLQQPLRYAENDSLERWIDDLLLLNNRMHTTSNETNNLTLAQISPTELVADPQQICHFYRLLALAHYRTSPLDLRRLLDAQGQRFWLLRRQGEISGGIWALAEGGIADADLIEKIWRGERRPAGNLVAQALCFQADLPQACALRSLRISRIALPPSLQRQGFGQQLARQLLEDCGAELDFISVSFGYSDGLAEFWQKCGFRIIHLSSGKEASSGCYSAMAIYPLSPDGERFYQQARQQFLRNFPLAEHPLFPRLKQLIAFPEIDWQLNADDLRQLHGFAEANRTLAATYPALRRLIKATPEFDWQTLQQSQDGKKQRLQQWRTVITGLI
ncbi:tRNA(Met) cytidine acetyltransferase [Testudinibacter sp. TR-2022]|uniref:GNAT family N-acetyltransferase n=1 Tax=Testudinibacter sp. TR-2022 TaxID=2585029 RepID=UPI001117E9FD|nr:GNAT family N-acetyltransferase [Testudinibacter sp. TR-2022]TNH03305.1 tRNA(Met) cytidine acetyltransferase [Pasteurellaceae bacterium Phil31]TNH08179.1 tRNA(Met) cytidine acetyltransferase [Testudinibacter sp. TR-2022]TNH11396.1 tRNA(Met) cytidine acetyltransferase [Testudinibacter sp. TR-2022]TNH13152.1 tRNA(Met) cytidine acetyltransferase [Testudinibacter sp. TR-2022]TNH17163.1 tRNA(Met) cytidine acetyltransferase [Testudinibacter sp. TR-2022]